MAKTVNTKATATPATVATVATVAQTVATPATVAKVSKYNNFAAQNAQAASVGALVAAHSKGKATLWAMPTHGNAAQGVAGQACALWLNAYKVNNNQTPTQVQLVQAVIALCTSAQNVKAGRGVSYAAQAQAVAQGQINAQGVAWALGYLCYTGAKTKGKVSLI